MKQIVNNFLRNKNCVINHIPLAKEKIHIIKKLGITQDNQHWLEIKCMLEKLHFGEISVKSALETLSAISGMPLEEIKSDLLFCYQTGLLECHITDVCNLTCIHCHYRKKQNATLPFSALQEYIETLCPKAITVTGGGEPNCYKSQGKTHNDVTALFKSIDPDMELGLINNNTFIPEGDWYNRYDWQRTSVDAINREQYKYIKGVDMYDACIHNIEHFLDSDISFVGIGFLFRDENIESIPIFLQDWFKRYLSMSKSAQEKFNIQFRPIAPDIDIVEHYDSGSMDKRMAQTVQDVNKLAVNIPGFDLFLREKTNFHHIDNSSGSYFLHTPKPFANCYNALLHRVLRADGTEYPDFLLCNRSDMALGNVLQTKLSPDLERIKIALGTFYFYHRLAAEHCNPKICRQGWVSNAIETNWAANVEAMGYPRQSFF
ncbi:hypothetical protein [Candidatus Bathycorpusculum sp.]|uniref:hypothetical protein n=1 Tax=Candidatus Bathycorpusculum sp. TaxID=2994959 RepID=UPI002819A182|nr:hypothetical protein [Candidatus Termitimicrobium sp.]